ncbi:MAG: EamA family transporter [Candidatus Paceibacterota bacterium]
MTIIFSYIFYFIAASIAPLQRRWLIRSKTFTPSEQINFTFKVIFILFLGSLTFPLFSPFYISNDTFKLVALAVVAGIFGAGCNMLQYIAQKHLDAGVTTIVANIYTPVTILLSFFILNEGLTSSQIVGTVLLLCAMVIVSKKHRIGNFKFDKYFLLMLLSGLLLAVLLVTERMLMKVTGFSAGIMISWGSQAFTLGLVTLYLGSKHTYSTKEVAVTGILQFFQACAWVVLVYSVGNLSLVSSITTFKVVIIFIAAAIFLKEREDIPRKIFGSILAVIGLLLM